MKTILVTGGAGFIGFHLIKSLLSEPVNRVVNLDAFTYAGEPSKLAVFDENERYVQINGDICDSKLVKEILDTYQPNVIFHLAAESHVDRSISGSHSFIRTNVVGTHTLLHESERFWSKLPSNLFRNFRFIHVSTDEVYGDAHSIFPDCFDEQSTYNPSSPYSASKASSDLLVKSWFRTYNFPAIITNCSNNFGIYQYPEKLIPVVIKSAYQFMSIPVYGDGKQVRDWIFVEDHVNALLKISAQGKVGESYNIGSNNEVSNLDIIKKICKIIDKTLQRAPGTSFSLVSFVEDRKGHDVRYAICSDKIKSNLNWEPLYDFDTTLNDTVMWYLNNDAWINEAISEKWLNDK